MDYTNMKSHPPGITQNTHGEGSNTFEGNSIRNYVEILKQLQQIFSLFISLYLKGLKYVPHYSTYMYM